MLNDSTMCQPKPVTTPVRTLRKGDRIFHNNAWRTIHFIACPKLGSDFRMLFISPEGSQTLDLLANDRVVVGFDVSR
jgi:hypothetical protein